MAVYVGRRLSGRRYISKDREGMERELFAWLQKNRAIVEVEARLTGFGSISSKFEMARLFAICLRR